MQAQADFTVLPNYRFTDHPAMDAFCIPGVGAVGLPEVDHGLDPALANEQLDAAAAPLAKPPKRPRARERAPERGEQKP